MKEALHTLKKHNISQDSIDTMQAIFHSTQGESKSVKGVEKNS